MKRVLYIPGAVCALVFCGALNSATWTWRTYTSMLEIRDLTTTGSRVWCATEGGLLEFEPEGGVFEEWRNTEGLSSNEMTALTSDTSGALWLGFANGLLQRLEPTTGRSEVFEDYRNHRIARLEIQGDSMFVALDLGVSLFLLSRREVKETYRKLGTQLQTEIPVRDLLVVEDTLWAVTDEGVAHAVLHGRNLLDPESWTSAMQAGGSALKKPACIVDWNGRVVVGGQNGVALFEGGAWGLLAGGSPVANVVSLAESGDTLFAGTSDGVHYWKDRVWTRTGESFACLGIWRSQGRLFAGSREGLRIFIPASGTWTSSIPNCPASNRVSDMVVDQGGVLWCCSSFYQGSGIYRFDGTRWDRWNQTTHPFFGTNNVGCVTVDRFNRKWFGTWGKGLVRFDPDSTGHVYATDNGFLSTSDLNDRNYPAVSDVAVDTAGALWVLNFNAMSYQPLVSVSADTVWTYFGASEGVTDRALRVLGVDGANRKWVGTDRAGLFVLDDGGTAWDPSDDPSVERITTADGLTRDEITALAVDMDGTVWIGTTDGLFAYAFGTITQIYAYYADPITALMVDGVGNVWVGTHLGVGYFPTATYTVTHFTDANSPLAGNDITALAYDPETGRVYIGTAQGLSCVETPFSKTLPRLDRLAVHPNPFFPGRHAFVSVDGLSGGVSIAIFTANGLPVRRYPTGNAYGRRLFWDGRNDRGESVASGIYVIVVQADDGTRAVAKVAVIR